MRRPSINRIEFVARVKRAPNATPIPEEILRAAIKVFGADGYEGASTKAIAAEAGVTPAALYYHYKDKRELLAKGLEWIAQSVFDAVQVSPESIQIDPAKALSGFVGSYITFQLTKIRSIAPMYTSLVHGVQQKRDLLTPKQMHTLRGIEHRYLDVLREILDAGARKGLFSDENPTLTAFAIIGMCEHTLSWVKPSGDAKVADIAAYYSRLALKMASSTPATAKR